MPAEADRRVFAAAPAVVVISTFLVFLVIPMGPDLVVKDLDVGVFYALAVSSLSVIGVLMAGWASANKFALLGALRAAGQLIAYELPLLLAVVGVVIQAGTMNLRASCSRSRTARSSARLDRQPVHPHAVHRLRPLPRRRAGRAHADAVRHARRRERARRRLHGRVHRLPLPLLLHRRVRHRVRVRGARGHAVPRRLGDPGVHGDAGATFLGPVVLFAKIMVVAFLMFWVRFTYPRLREDQLQALAWKFLIPIGLAQHPAHRRLQGGVLMAPQEAPRRDRRSRHHVQDDAEAGGHGAVPAREGRPAHARAASSRSRRRTARSACCARAQCPDWCIYIEGHKEKRPPRREGGRDRTVSVLDRFDIDYALCMYCGICVEVCPFDALFWSPEYEYSESQHRQAAPRQEEARRVDGDRARARAARDRRREGKKK